MKKLLFGGAAALTLAMGATAFAADLPVKAAPMVAPAFSWTGFYIGANAGGAWGHSDTHTYDHLQPDRIFRATSPTAISAVGAQTVNSSGFTGGGQVRLQLAIRRNGIRTGDGLRLSRPERLNERPRTLSVLRTHQLHRHFLGQVGLAVHLPAPARIRRRPLAALRHRRPRGFPGEGQFQLHRHLRDRGGKRRGLEHQGRLDRRRRGRIRPSRDRGPSRLEYLHVDLGSVSVNSTNLPPSRRRSPSRRTCSATPSTCGAISCASVSTTVSKPQLAVAALSTAPPKTRTDDPGLPCPGFFVGAVFTPRFAPPSVRCGCEPGRPQKHRSRTPDTAS